MSRQARQRSATEVYHVIQRGIDRMAIFYDDEDRQMVLNGDRVEFTGILAQFTANTADLAVIAESASKRIFQSVLLLSDGQSFPFDCKKQQA